MTTQEVINQVFPKDPDELWAKLIKMGLVGARELDAPTKTRLKKGMICYTVDGRVCVGIPNYTTFITFTYVYKYPACCALSQIHTFSYSTGRGVDQEWFNALMTCILREHIELDRNKRIEIMMVEHRGGMEHLCNKYKLDPESDLRVFDFPMVENPEMFYPMFYEFWHSYAKKVNTRLMYNCNTGNIIHNMEVILP